MYGIEFFIGAAALAAFAVFGLWMLTDFVYGDSEIEIYEEDYFDDEI